MFIKDPMDESRYAALVPVPGEKYTPNECKSTLEPSVEDVKYTRNGCRRCKIHSILPSITPILASVPFSKLLAIRVPTVSLHNATIFNGT
jgi:hypothetical protein